MMFRPMVRPRRPILRAAMVGGTAYAAGRSQVKSQMREQDQESRLEQLEAQQAQAAPMPTPSAVAPPAAAPAAAAPAAGGDDIASKLVQLKGLLDQGVLSPEEFESAKQKLLAG